MCKRLRLVSSYKQVNLRDQTPRGFYYQHCHANNLLISKNLTSKVDNSDILYDYFEPIRKYQTNKRLSDKAHIKL